MSGAGKARPTVAIAGGASGITHFGTVDVTRAIPPQPACSGTKGVELIHGRSAVCRP